MRKPFVALMACLLATSCTSGGDDGVLKVAIIGTTDQLFADGVRLTPPGQHIRAAQAQGLVRLDEAGNVVPAIAERWIVTDDGVSYIFRIREFDLPGGGRLTAQTVRDSLRRTLTRLSGTSLGLDLAKVSEVRAMTGRVVEIRLKSPMRGFLQVLAQPELGLMLQNGHTGPMALTREGDIAVLDAMPPEMRGLPSQDDWGKGLLQLRVSAVDAQRAVDGFSDAEYDLLLGGRLTNLPLADTGPLSRGTVRLDAAIGLFGLDVAHTDGFLAEPANREALAQAIDRNALMQPFNIGGWTATTRLVASGLPGDAGLVGERWDGTNLEQRRIIAAGRVAQWEQASGRELELRIALPAGPGSDLLFRGLAADMLRIGATAKRVGADDPADLRLRDRVARYGEARWFLNQFNCNFTNGPCAKEADDLVARSIQLTDPAAEAAMLAEAERVLTAANIYIPLGAPIRWSQVRGGVDGFIENAWALHPLFPLSRAPI